MRVVAFCLGFNLSELSYRFIFFDGREKIQNFCRREKPQCCSQCREEGHNKGSIRCPVNMKNAATATSAKERQIRFSEDQLSENAKIWKNQQFQPFARKRQLN